jgi:hypothetical protein
MLNFEVIFERSFRAVVFGAFFMGTLNKMGRYLKFFIDLSSLSTNSPFSSNLIRVILQILDSLFQVGYSALKKTEQRQLLQKEGVSLKFIDGIHLGC